MVHWHPLQLLFAARKLREMIWLGSDGLLRGWKVQNDRPLAGTKLGQSGFTECHENELFSICYEQQHRRIWGSTPLHNPVILTCWTLWSGHFPPSIRGRCTAAWWLRNGCLSCANQATHPIVIEATHCDMDIASPEWCQELVAVCSDMAMTSPGLRRHCDTVIVSHHLSKKK